MNVSPSHAEIGLSHWFSYFPQRGDTDRMPSIVQPRDAEASSLIRHALQDMGMPVGHSILNYPARQCCFDLCEIPDLARVDVPFLSPADCIVLVTRPPLDEGRHGDKRKIEPSNTTLERLLFLVFWRYLHLCSRSHVVLTEEAAHFLPKAMKNRARMTFAQQGCKYTGLGALDGKVSRPKWDSDRTAGFVLNVAEAFEEGPGLIAAWGPSGHATLALSMQLRHRYPHLLQNRGLTIVDLHPQPVPDRPSNHLWALDWDLTPVMEMKCELPPRPEEKGLVIPL